jgi:hypothetical protein
VHFRCEFGYLCRGAAEICFVLGAAAGRAPGDFVGNVYPSLAAVLQGSAGWRHQTMTIRGR